MTTSAKDARALPGPHLPPIVKRGEDLHIHSSLKAINQAKVGGVNLITSSSTPGIHSVLISDKVPLGESEVSVHTMNDESQVVGRVIVTAQE
ncbi:hypothetical protein [Pseudomonas sp. nanlin1]|uniref:hypothetical protein n=1 Tax=Pseudomonas sp. nanlin1 TaxID=3040605 RepID=UPI003890FE8F